MKQTKKKCPKCAKYKIKSDFHKNSRLKDGLACWCKDCVRINSDKHYTKNKDEINKVRRGIYHSKEGQVKYKKRYKAKRKNKLIYNKKYYDKNQKKLVKQKREYRQTNIGKAVEKNSKHNRRQKLSKSKIDSFELLKLLENSIICEICNNSMSNEYNLKNSKSIDHIILISIGGENKLSNLRIICFGCNSKRPRDGRDLLQSKKYKKRFIKHLKYIKLNRDKNKEYKKIFKKLEYIIESLNL